MSTPACLHKRVPALQQAGGSSRVRWTRVPVCRRRCACSGFLEDVILKPITTAGQVGVLNEGIRTFYDQSSRMWEDIWGEHMHHGYYDVPNTINKTRTQAQIDMIENTLNWANVKDVSRMVDVGCGIGGSSRHVARKFGAVTEGITLSPKQAQRGNEISAQAGLADVCNFQVADALQQPFANDSFDLAWSLESGEHMPDKRKFVNELVRVTAPNGHVIIVTWCHRNLLPGERGLTADELSLLKRISEAYYLPDWCSLADYQALFEEAGMENIKTADWSDNVAPFWGEVIQSALTVQGVQGLMGTGWDTIKGALVMPLMKRGYEMGLIKFALITATKPATKTENT